MFPDVRERFARVTAESLIDVGQKAIPTNGISANHLRSIYIRTLKSARAIRYATTYWMGKERKGRGTGPGGSCRRAAGGARSRLRRKWRSWYISPRAITHLVLAYVPPAGSPSHPVWRTALASFSFPPFFPSLYPYRPHLNFSSYSPLSARWVSSAVTLSLYTFRALFAWLYARIISERALPGFVSNFILMLLEGREYAKDRGITIWKAHIRRGYEERRMIIAPHR